MVSLISHLSPADKRQLFDDMYYCNTEELRTYCKMHQIPYAIYVTTESGTKKKTSDTDRKALVLDRIRHFLESGKILDATCFAAQIVRLDGPPGILKSTDRLYYGWYNKSNEQLAKLLKDLTNGKFRDGAVARILMREYWTDGVAPTLSEFAESWIEADRRGLGFHPEAAWLTDRARHEAGENWKSKRKKKAARVLNVLNSIDYQHLALNKPVS